jgi:DNA-binding FadR family transcriptional regulator
VVRTAVGSGPEAGAIVVADPIRSIGAALRFHTATRHLPIADLVDTRILLESWSLREAADHRPKPELSSLEATLDAMDDTTLTAEEFLRLDAAFHVAMSELAGNVVVAAMMAALRDSIQGYVLAGVPLLDDWVSVANTLRTEHRAILNAVRRGHGARAGELVGAHIRGYFDRIRR